MKKAIFLFCLMLLYPGFALADDECCFQGPGKCFEINSPQDREKCEKSATNVVLDDACKEAPECQLSEEPPANSKSPGKVPDRKSF
jgi:hypothetical protein